MCKVLWAFDRCLDGAADAISPRFMSGSRGPFVSGLDRSANRQGATDLDVSIVPRIGRRRGLRALAVVHLSVGLIIGPIGKVRKILGQAA